MLAFSIESIFQSVASLIDSEDDNQEGEGSGAIQLSPWKYKKGRNGLKGRTPKHPMNKRAYTC